MPTTRIATKKFRRERDQRWALLRGLATSLVEYESIETTLIKAKALRPYAEKLITKAKRGDLHARRQVLSSLDTPDAAHKLIDEIAPKIKRDSGYLRIEKTTLRRGDGTQMAKISFVDSLEEAPVKAKASKVAKKQPAKADSKKETSDAK